MKSQGSLSLRRAISLDRLSASFGKKKRSSAGMASSPDNHFEDGSAGSSGIRTATHRTSYTGFLNWVTYSRDLSPDITEDQRRTCPVCEDMFQNRRNMLQHIPTCFKLPNGFYRCIQCDRKEKIGRYHTNGCNEVHIYQDSWLKRILSFRSSKILVDASDVDVPVDQSTQESWERVELPSESLVELDGTRCVQEMAGTEYLDWTAPELDGGLNTWDSVDVAAWQSSVAGESNWSIQEMPAWQPQELAGDGYESFGTSSTPTNSDAASQESFTFASLSPPESVYAAAKANHPAADRDDITERSNREFLPQAPSPRPLLRLVTNSFLTESHIHHEDYNERHLYNNVAAYCPDDKFLAYPDLQQIGNDLPSPPTSPIQWFEHDVPVSPMEANPHSSPASRYSTFSSLSSMVMDDVPMSSFSTSHVSESTTQSDSFFDDNRMCPEPDNIEDGGVSSSNVFLVPYPTAVATDEQYDPEVEGSLPVLNLQQNAADDSSDACLQLLHAKLDSCMSDYFSQWSDGSNLEGSPSASSLQSEQFEKQWVTADSFGLGLNDIGDQSSNDSPFSSPGSEPQQSSTTSSIESSSPEEVLIDSLKATDRPSLSRSPAFRAVYRCTYGSCTFEPTGKKAYYKRTLQRHQEKCSHSPLPREKKPCKCTYPGCNKGFSRSDGLNAHRKTSRHWVKIELQVMDENDQVREAVELL